MAGGLAVHASVGQLHAGGQGAGFRVSEENGDAFAERVVGSTENGGVRQNDKCEGGKKGPSNSGE